MRELIWIGANGLKSFLKFQFSGIPKYKGSLESLARNAIYNNSREGIIKAAESHLVYEWVVDSAKAFRGIILGKALPLEFLEKRVDIWIQASLNSGYVPTSFSGSRSFDIPQYRIDGLPWLIHAVACLGLLEEKSVDLQLLLDKYLERSYNFQEHMLKREAVGDWADTKARGSSTYANICLLRALQAMDHNEAQELERSLLEHRWTGCYFQESADSGEFSSDAVATALYFQLFPREVREKMASFLESSGFLKIPLKIRTSGEKDRSNILSFISPQYHFNVVWPHMGCMALIGLKALGRNIEVYQRSMEDIIRKQGFLEVLDSRGGPYISFFHITDWNLTMLCGLYLELVYSDQAN